MWIFLLIAALAGVAWLWAKLKPPCGCKETKVS